MASQNLFAVLMVKWFEVMSSQITFAAPPSYKYVLSAALQFFTNINKSSGHWFPSPPVHRRRSCPSPLPTIAPREGSLGGSLKDSFGPCVIHLVSSWQDRMVTHLRGQFPLVSAYSPKQGTSHFIQLRNLCVGADEG